MICQNCQADNEPGARFCDSCGVAIQVIASEPVILPSKIPEQIRCSGCGSFNPPKSTFCENCGMRLVLQTTENVYNTPHSNSPPKGKTSVAWWLLPVFMGWLGGLIAFLVVKDVDRSKAIKVLICGLVFTVLWIVAVFLASFIPYLLMENGFWSNGLSYD